MSTTPDSLEWRYYLWLSAICTTAAALLAWIGRDGFWHINVVSAIFWLFLMTALGVSSLLIIVRLLMDLFANRSLTQSLRWLITVLVVMATPILGLLGADWLLGRQIDASLQWVDAAVMEIEAFKHQQGRYPTSFDELPETLPPMPRYLQEFGMYHSENPGHWEIAVLDARQGELLESWVYSSRTRAWQVQKIPPERFQ